MNFMCCAFIKDGSRLCSRRAKSTLVNGLCYCHIHLKDLGMCPICLETMRYGDSFVTSCGHNFHLHCLTHWLKSKSSCPMCRCEIVGKPTAPTSSRLLQFGISKPEYMPLIRNIVSHQDGEETLLCKLLQDLSAIQDIISVIAKATELEK